jgi:hypothetical protein
MSMPTMPVVTLRQVVVEPPPAFCDVITPELLRHLKMQPVPVLFLQAKENVEWGGYCDETEFTERGEIVIADHYVETTLRTPRPRHIRLIYLHECAHRLMQGGGHNGAFIAMNLVLFLRADAADPDRRVSKGNAWHDVSFYDMQDEVDRLPEVFFWAWPLANELAQSEKSAEECAEVISSRYGEWVDWMSRAEEREAQAAASSKAASERWKSLKRKIEVLRSARWHYFIYGTLAGFLIAASFNLLLN